jgi:predicted RNA binding protein YcfA (HicA-like mRNA interferase family)
LGEFYKTTKQKKIIKLLKSLGFRFEESAKHIKAYCPKTGRWTTVPRHTELKSGTSESIANFLIELGYDKKIIAKALS